jgi:hypothetical protein
MKRQYAFIAIGVVVIAVIIGLAAYADKNNESPAAAVNHALDAFAQCLTQKGVTFYGAFWCPHCQRTKAMFGGASEYLPYVECSTPDGQSQDAVCNKAGVVEYPTWQFPDGSRLVGETGLEALAEKSGCVLPAGFASSTPSNPIFPGETSASTSPDTTGAASSAL